MSAASASASPPPTAGPWIAAITGNGRSRIAASPPVAASWKDRNSRTPMSRIAPTSARSNPEQKALSPAPRRITARAPLSRKASAASVCSWNMVCVCELARSGRSTVSTATPSARSSTSSVSSSTRVVGRSSVVVISAP
jgi:hypothetical protein